MRHRTADRAVTSTSQARFFETATAFRAWLQRHHGKARIQWVGFYRKASGKRSITYPEALDEALCFGWIDGLRKRVSNEAYIIRFTPRKPASIWSRKNSTRARELIEEGRMRPAGLAAFAARDERRSGVYSFENRPRALDPAYERQFRAAARAWAFFQSQPAGYRRTCAFWVMSAKRDATQHRRLGALIACSAEGRRLPQLSPPSST